MAEEYETLNERKLEMELMINRNDSILESLENATGDIHHILTQISDPVVNEYYDGKLTHYAELCGVSIEEIVYQDSFATYPSVNYHDSETVYYELQEEITRLNQESSHKKESKTSSFEILRHPLTVKFNASPQKTASFITQLHSDKETIYLRDLVYDYESLEGQIEIDIYSIEKIKQNDVLESSQINDESK